MQKQSRSALKRLRRDAQYLKEHPMVGASAAPTEDNIFVWHLNFNINFDLDNETYNIPLHAILEAPSDYPANPPNVGFCTKFPYRMGASYVNLKPGPLHNTFVLCLNILGNFAHVHTEWKNLEGQGWSPSMSIETVLIQLQTMLMDLNLSTAEKRDLLRKTQAFTCVIDEDEDLYHTFTNPWPVLYSAEQVEQQMQQKQFLTRVTNQCDNQTVENIHNLFTVLSEQRNNETTTEYMSVISSLLDLLNQKPVATMDTDENITNEEIVDDASMTSESSTTIEATEPVIHEDPTIVCYCSYVSYLNDILGYGVTIDKKHTKTPGELLSRTSFFDDGINQSTTKKRFKFWIPAFINETHIKHEQWYTLTCNSLQSLADTLYANAKELSWGRNLPKKTHPVLDVLPNLINSMIVEIMKGDRADAIAYFESLCSFWRMLRWFLFESPQATDLYKKAMRRLERFCKSSDGRHKNYVPDVGQLLALYTCLTDQVQESLFVDGYVEEALRRGTMWWLEKLDHDKDAITANRIFRETKVGRDLFMFQLTVMRELIENDPERTCTLMDQSCGKLPEKLNNLQQHWREVQPAIESWTQYFKFVRLSPRSKYYDADMEVEVKALPDIAAAAGRRYIKKRTTSIKNKKRNRQQKQVPYNDHRRYLRPLIDGDNPPARPNINAYPPVRPNVNHYPPVRPNVNHYPPVRPNINQYPPVGPNNNDGQLAPIYNNDNQPLPQNNMNYVPGLYNNAYQPLAPIYNNHLPAPQNNINYQPAPQNNINYQPAPQNNYNIYHNVPYNNHYQFQNHGGYRIRCDDGRDLIVTTQMQRVRELLHQNRNNPYQNQYNNNLYQHNAHPVIQQHL